MEHHLSRFAGKISCSTVAHCQHKNPRHSHGGKQGSKTARNLLLFFWKNKISLTRYYHDCIASVFEDEGTSTEGKREEEEQEREEEEEKLLLLPLSSPAGWALFLTPSCCCSRGGRASRPSLSLLLHRTSTTHISSSISAQARHTGIYATSYWRLTSQRLSVRASVRLFCI